MASILVLSIDPVSGHLVAYLIPHNGHGTMLQSRINGMSENGFHLLRSCGSGDVPVSRNPVEKTVPDAAAYHVSLKSMII